MLHSEQKCAHFYSERIFVGYGTGASWNLWNWSIERKKSTAGRRNWELEIMLSAMRVKSIWRNNHRHEIEQIGFKPMTLCKNILTTVSQPLRQHNLAFSQRYAANNMKIYSWFYRALVVVVFFKVLGGLTWHMYPYYAGQLCWRKDEVPSAIAWVGRKGHRWRQQNKM